MEYKIEAKSKKVGAFLDSLMPSMIKQLGLTNSQRAVMIKVDRDVDVGFEGATYHLEWADCYVVHIRAPSRITVASLLNVASTLAHEMVHVSQLAHGKLKYLSDGKKMWCGKKYKKSTGYLDQPWEIGAFSKQELLLRRAIEV